MKKILVPISFSQASKNALQQAYSIANQNSATLSLLHCYPIKAYNRKYDFGKEDYKNGIKRMLVDFYNESIENGSEHSYNVLAYPGSFSEIVGEISSQYDLLLMCRKTGFKTTSYRYFNDKIFFVSSLVLCPVLISSPNQNEISFKQVSNIWHIERNKNEKDLVKSALDKFNIDTSLVVTKSLLQERFASTFWRDIVAYSKTHDQIFLKDITQSFRDERIDLLILVNHLKGMFIIFIKDYAFQILQQLEVPILIVQAKVNR